MALVTFLLDARGCKFHRVGLLTLLDIDCGCCTVGTRHEISVKEYMPIERIRARMTILMVKLARNLNSLKHCHYIWIIDDNYSI